VSLWLGALVIALAAGAVLARGRVHVRVRRSGREGRRAGPVIGAITAVVDLLMVRFLDHPHENQTAASGRSR
jgi:hypothetical protein